jgi:cation diffusion facilitator CzcD-associated flavoprotein CzcO
MGQQRSRRIAIIGSGYGGVCLGIRLKQAGVDSFTIYEKADRVGGTWRDNTYPGAACDSPIFAYCYSFEPKFDWSRKWVRQPEILAYLEHCVDKYGLRPHLRLGSEIASARFAEDTGVWHLTSTGGEESEADVVVCAVGQLNRPSVPAIAGLEHFAGPAFHSAQWDHDVDLTDKNVAVIGTAASAVQIIPEIAPQVRRLHVFQRSPNWLIPKLDHAYSQRTLRLLARLPGLARLYRWWLWLTGEIFLLPAIQRRPLLSRRLTRLAEEHLQAQVPDAELRRVLHPDYPIGAKRILITDDYYPALLRDNVDLVTAPIDHIDEHAVVTRDQTRREVDVIVLATGFSTTTFLAPMSIEGLGGRTLENEWQDGAYAYLGITVAGFPNLFMMYGPNTNLGHNSIVFMIECQTNYIMDCLRALDRLGLASIDVRRPVQDAYNEALQRELRRSAWAEVGKSWYKTASGRITNNWSGSTVRYWWKTRKADLGAFHQQRA